MRERKGFTLMELLVVISLVALLVSILTGIVAGLIPAYRASRLNPIDALRYE